MPVVSHAVGARLPRKLARSRIAIVNLASAAAWTDSSVDADRRAATARANEPCPCQAGQPVASAMDDCPAPAATMQSPCIRSDDRPSAQCHTATDTRFMSPLGAQQLPLRACAQSNLLTTPFAERALGP